MKVVNTTEYVSVLRELVEVGEEFPVNYWYEWK